ncbi:MAG: hypothetical protein HYV09_40870 [Deltaproteobacteria bacterium]|nr:hypothetical protein [Deltaproteobacteria bacterium]
MTFTWRSREHPLSARAVAAFGPAARALAASVGRRADAELHALRAVGAEAGIVVLGEEEALPWADGALYLGQDAAAPSLLLPTTLRPDLALPLVERALLRRVARDGVLAVIPSQHLLIPVDGARPLTRAHLSRWMG